MNTIIRSFLLLAIVALTSADAVAQVDTISYRQMGLGTGYRYHGKLLSMRKLSKIVNTDPQAALWLQRYKTNTVVSTALSFAAGYFVGYEIGRNKATGQSVRPGFIGASAVMLAVAIPIGHKANKQLKRSVRLYNNKVMGRVPAQ